MAAQDRGAASSSKDKEMAARLKKDPRMCERWTGRCAICYGIIRNGPPTYRHYSQHAFGGNPESE